MPARGPYVDQFEKLRANLALVGDCYVWTKTKDRDGYGRFTWLNKFYITHRLAYEAAYGPIPDDMSVLHRCDNPGCCTPEHLFLGTHLDNMRDKMAKGRWKGGRRRIRFPGA